MRRALAAVAALTAGLLATPASPAAAVTAGGRWVVSNERAVPLEWFQGLTHAPDGSRFFAGVFEGVTRTGGALRQQVRNDAAIPPAVKARYGFNHIGDPTYDRRHRRLLLPLECYAPGGRNGGNTCGRGGIGVLDPVTLQWRRLFLLGAGDVTKAMWAEVAPDGRLVWTSNGPDLVAYATADLAPANAAPAAPLRPVRRVADAVPPGGVTGAAFRGPRLLLAEPGDGRLRVWSVDLARPGSRRVEATLPVDAEAEGLDVLPTGDGLLHFLLSPLAPSGSPTYGPGHSEIVSLVPRAEATFRVIVVRHRSRSITVRVWLPLGGRPRPIVGALVRAPGARGRTDARGAVTLRTRVGPHRPVRVQVSKQQLDRDALIVPALPRRARTVRFTG